MNFIFVKAWCTYRFNKPYYVLMVSSKFTTVYSKSKLELNEKKTRTRVIQKSSVFLSFYFTLQAKLQVFKFEFVRLSWG